MNGKQQDQAGLPPHDLFARTIARQRLMAAWGKVRDNGGSAGGDGQSVDTFANAAMAEIARLNHELASGAYRPRPLREVDIPKQDGGQRRLSIPAVRDRIVQGAAALTLTPIMEARFSDASYGYRPGRSVQQAVDRIGYLRNAGFDWVVDADIEDFFDQVPHDPLLARLEDIIGEGPLPDLIAETLAMANPIGRGLPQGSPLSPLLANLYLDSVDKAIAPRGAKLIRFADDFVILTRGREAAEAALNRAATLLAEHGLRLNRDKTQVVSFERGFRFLGHLFVRSMTMLSPNREYRDPSAESYESLLRLAAQADRREADQEATEAEALAAGHDRSLRVLYVLEPHRRLNIRNTAFAVEVQVEALPSPVWHEIAAVPYRRVDRIEIGPAAHVTETALKHAAAVGVELAYVDGFGETLALVTAAGGLRARLHLAQAKMVLDPALRAAFARQLVDARIRNQRALLRRLNRRRKVEAVTEAALALNRELRALAHDPPDIQVIMGREGRAAAHFWPAFAQTCDAGWLRGPWAFKGRKRRPPPDPMNLTLNYLSSLLARDVGELLRRVGLHPGFGALHAVRDGDGETGAALVFDMMEPMRAPLVESLTIWFFNNRVLRREMFLADGDGGCRLARGGAAAIVRGWEATLARTVALHGSKPVRKVAWRRLMELQAQDYARAVQAGDAQAFRPYVMDY